MRVCVCVSGTHECACVRVTNCVRDTHCEFILNSHIHTHTHIGCPTGRPCRRNHLSHFATIRIVRPRYWCVHASVSRTVCVARTVCVTHVCHELCVWYWCVHTCVNEDMCSCLRPWYSRTHAHISIYLCVSVCVYLFMCIYKYLFMCIYKHLFMCIYKYLFMCIYKYLCMWIYS